MVLIKHAGKFITHLPDAIHQILQSVEFNSEAHTMRDLPDHPAEFEEEDVQVEEEPQGVPSSGTPPGPPPPWNPKETSSTGARGSSAN